MKLFLDTSALVKFFHVEQGSAEVEALVNDKKNEIWISELTRIEFLSAIHRKFREKLLTESELSVAINGFNEQLKNFHVEPIGIDVTERAEKLFRDIAKFFPLRTLDAIQLAAFLHIKESERFVLADEKLNTIAQAVGVKTLLIKQD